ncbi:MAG: hypothetical protein U9N59_06625 [Campylobacterota bacterium]|nr:hypothetical protein [Campylobacterota bacterium]
MKKLVKLIVVLMLVLNIQASDKFDVLEKFENAPSWVLTPTISSSKYYVVGSAKDDGYGYTKQYEEAIYNGWVEFSRINQCYTSTTYEIKRKETNKTIINNQSCETALVKPEFKIENSWTNVDNELFVLLSIEKDKLSLPSLRTKNETYRINKIKSHRMKISNKKNIEFNASLIYNYSYKSKKYSRNKYQHHLSNKERNIIYNNLPNWSKGIGIEKFGETGIGSANLNSYDSFI